jgi:catechol 2,3-dioxygenase-like lactoylglutathione lyase family enzyme
MPVENPKKRKRKRHLAAGPDSAARSRAAEILERLTGESSEAPYRPAVVDKGLTSTTPDGYELVIGSADGPGGLPSPNLRPGLTTADHLGVRVRDLKAAVAGFRSLGFEPEGVESHPEVGVDIVFLDAPGTLPIELLQVTDPKSPAASDDVGLHHIAIRCDHLESSYRALTENPLVRVVGEITTGAHGRRLFFFRIEGEPILFECVATEEEQRSET